MPIIGLTGKIGSGKTTLSAYIQKKYNFQKLSFVDKILIPELRKRKKTVNRKNLQQVGREFYLKYGDIKFTDLLLEGIDPTEKWIIDDIRYPLAANYIRNRFLNNFWLIGVKADIQIRFQRILARGKEGKISYEDFLKMDSAPTEKWIEEVLSQADYLVENNGALPDFYQQCDRIIKEIQDRF
jgi:dephospho-CoA kinase